MKLELKHLAPYLPYELNTKYPLFTVIGDVELQKNEVRDKKLTAENVDFVLEYCTLMLLNPINITKEIADDFYTGTEPYDDFKANGLRIKYTYKNQSYWMESDMDKGFENVDKMNKHHIDYRGLIKKGLAIDK